MEFKKYSLAVGFALAGLCTGVVLVNTANGQVRRINALPVNSGQGQQQGPGQPAPAIRRAPMPMAGGGNTIMLMDNNDLYVLQGSHLFQVSKINLNIRNQTDLRAALPRGGVPPLSRTPGGPPPAGQPAAPAAPAEDPGAPPAMDPGAPPADPGAPPSK